MISIDRLTEKDLEVFKGKNVILYGLAWQREQIYKLFKKNNIKVIAFCDASIEGRFFYKYKNIPVISPSKIGKISEKYNNIIVQCIGFDAEKIQNMKKNVSQYNVEISDLPSGAILSSFAAEMLLGDCENKELYKMENKNWIKLCNRKVNLGLIRFNLRKVKVPIFLCLPPKTADYTLNNTFDKFNLIYDVNAHKKLNVIQRFFKPLRPIEYLNFFHKARFFHKKNLKRKYPVIKVITAVREPISQNISLLYQGLSSGGLIKDWILGDLSGLSDSEKNMRIKELKRIFGNDENRVQDLFDNFIQRYVYPENGRFKPSMFITSIQYFNFEFNNYILDITKYPFNQEKGYTVIKEDNIEVFVYQLEKLNNLVPELSEWVGVPFKEFVRGNDASDKWIADSYKQAQKELEITQEYFDRSFSESYVQHCYSQEDIEKFKARWRPHIKNNRV